MSDGRSPQAPSRRFRLKAFVDAWNGILFVIRTQPNARIHLAATVGAIVVGAWFGLTAGEWSALICAVTIVWVAEALNTAIELTVNLASPEWQRLAGWAKDTAAGAVLLAALGSIVVGAIIFGPKLWALL